MRPEYIAALNNLMELTEWSYDLEIGKVAIDSNSAILVFDQHFHKKEPESWYSFDIKRDQSGAIVDIDINLIKPRLAACYQQRIDYGAGAPCHLQQFCT